MKYLGRFAALAGLGAAIWLLLRSHPATVLGLLRTAGWGLLLAGAAHILPMLANARDWQMLVLPEKRVGTTRSTLRMGAMLRLVWLRESINCLLPVARVGGELAAFRLMRRQGLSGPTIVGSLVVDTQLTLISQVLCALLGIGYLLGHANSAGLHLAGKMAWGLAGLTPVLMAFVLIQHANPFQRLTHLLNRVLRGRLSSLVEESSQIDEQIRLIWQRRWIIVQYIFFWQILQCLGVGLELWLALHFMHARLSLAGAFVFESLIQAISSAAFFIPGGLGVQEGGFLLIGRALGLGAPAALALAGARRIRDLLIYVPGLIYWQWAEAPR